MPLILPDNYPISANFLTAKNNSKIHFSSEVKNKDFISLAIINIMPEAEKYEELLLTALLTTDLYVEINFVKLNNHTYKSSDKNHLKKYYSSFDKIEEEKIDGLILTGAPVELMDYESITYYNELLGIFNFAETNIKSTLGICWGAIFTGHYLGIDKLHYTDKLFGVFPSKNFSNTKWYNPEKTMFYCPQSRYSGLSEPDLNKAVKAGKINILAYSEEAGSYIFETVDHKFVSHLGHPEYNTERLVFEFLRDQEKQLNHIPQYFDVNHAINNWHSHSTGFFNSWLKLISY